MFARCQQKPRQANQGLTKQARKMKRSENNRNQPKCKACHAQPQDVQ